MPQKTKQIGWCKGKLVVRVDFGDGRTMPTRSQEIKIRLAVSTIDEAILKMTEKIR
jgi:hypothetical protein